MCRPHPRRAVKSNASHLQDPHGLRRNQPWRSYVFEKAPGPYSGEMIGGEIFREVVRVTHDINPDSWMYVESDDFAPAEFGNLKRVTGFSRRTHNQCQQGARRRPV